MKELKKHAQSIYSQKLKVVRGDSSKKNKSVSQKEKNRPIDKEELSLSSKDPDLILSWINPFE
jgi:hypothetical protein